MKDGTRSVKHKASLGRRILSATLAMVMCFSTMQVVAFASDDGIATQADMQIEGCKQYDEPVYYTWDANAKKFSGTASTGAEVANGQHEDVVISKSIAATGVENEFEITLDVQTNQTIETTVTYPNVAVTLVLDVSNSLSTEDMAAMNAALCGNGAFLDKLAANANGAKRMVSLVTFCKDSKLESGWVDITNPANLKTIKDEIEDLTLDYGTNTQGGLLLAKELLEQDVVSPDEFAYRYVVLMTDGNPNTIVIKKNMASGGIEAGHYVGSYYDCNDNSPNGWHREDLYDGSAWQVHKHFSSELHAGQEHGDPSIYSAYRAQEIAENICAMENTELYAIGYGNDLGNKIHDKEYTNQYDTKKTLITGKEWLKDNVADQPDHYFDADVNKLSTTFQSIVNEITVQANAWMVTDPMGEHMILLDGKALEESVPGVHVDPIVGRPDKILWNLRQANKGEDGHYTMKYKVKLDVAGILQAKGESSIQEALDKYYLTNGETSLTYYIKDANGNYLNDEHQTIDINQALMTMHFKVPAVRGYVANLSFKKVSSLDESGLANCGFKLTHHEDCICDEDIVDDNGTYTASSREDGGVTFNCIPSGHVYVLKEVSAPSGYDNNANTSTISVSYGVATVTGGKLVINGVVTNTPSAKPEVFKVIKKWTGAASVDEVTVNIHKVNKNGTNGDIVAELNLNTANNWTDSVTLPTIDVATKTAIVYRAVEAKGDNYQLLSGGDFDVNHVATLNNVRTGTDNIIIQKNWAAPSNLRPAVTVRLLQDGVTFGEYTLSSGNWSKTISVPTYSNAGKAYEYTVVELDANGNAVSDSGSITVNGHTYKVSISGTTVTNTLDQEYTSVSGIKTWNVAGLTDAEKSALSATITLYQNGNVYKTAEVTYADNTYSFAELPKYTEDRTAEYSYIVAETAVSGNTSGTWAKTQNGTNFTNTITDQVTISGTKTWVDPDESERPESITIKLMSGNTVVDSRTISARPVAEATAEEGTEGETNLVNEDPAVEYTWKGVELSYSFTVPKYDASGAVIPYNIVEENVPMYQATYDGYNVTNTLNGGEKTISAQKIWVDAAGEHNAVTVGVYRDGSDTQAAVIELNQENKWAGSVNVPKYDGGAEIKYIVREINSDGIAIEDNGSYGENYTVSYEKTGDNWIVKNQINQELISVSGQKTWVGSGEHPAVTFTLYKNGVSTGQTRTQEDLNAENGNLFTFEGLEKYTFSGDTCTVNTYTIKETMSGTPELLARYGYDGTPVMGTVDNDGVFQFVNTFTNDETSVSGQKTWYGMGYTAEVNVGLFTGGEMISSQTTEELKFNFTGLTKYNADGTLVQYSIFELDDQNKPMEEGTYYTSNGEEYEVHYNGYNIDNILKQKTTSVPVTKVWRGASAESVTFELYRAEGENGTPAAVLDADGLPMTLTLTAEDIDEETGFWKGSFEGLDVYNASRTAEYVYSVKESGVENGTVTLSGNTYTAEAWEGNIFVNTIVDPNTGTFTVNKAWAGEGYNAENGEVVTVQLFANNVAYGEPITLDKDNDWTHTFNNLPLYSAETYSPLTYTVGELDENGALVADGGIISMNDGAERYVVTYNGGTITNTLKDADSYKYRILRHYTYSYDGAVSTYTDDDLTWTAASKDEVVNIDATQWNNCSTDDKDVVYGFVGEQTDVYQGTNNEYAFTQDGSVVSFVTEKFVDGESWYEVYLFYNYSYSTPPYIPPYVPPVNPPVDPPVDPPQEPPVTPPEEPVITPEEPDVPAGDKEIDDPLHNLNDADGDIPMEGLEIEDPNVPKTADESNVNTWMLIALLSGMALAVSVLTERRQFKHKA